MRMNEFMMLYQVKLQRTELHCLTFHAFRKIMKSWFGPINRTSCEWWKDEVKVFGPWDEHERASGLQIPHEYWADPSDKDRVERLNEADEYREDFIFAA